MSSLCPVQLAAAILFALALTGSAAADPQRTFYDARGNVTGRAATDSQGTTTFYDARGNVVGKSSAPRSGKVRSW